MNPRLVTSRVARFILSMSLALFFSSHARGDIGPSFYLGVEGQYHHYKVENTIRSSSGNLITRGNNRPLFSEENIAGGLFLGSNILELVGIEAGYLQFKNSKTVDNLVYNMVAPGVAALQVRSTNSFNARHHNGYVDILGYIPVPLGLDFIASIGAGCLTSRVTNTTQASAFVNMPPNALTFTSSSGLVARSTKIGVRLGLGTQFKLGDAGARFMVRYQKGNELIRNILSAGVGLYYQFY